MPRRLNNLYAELVIELDCSFGAAGWDCASPNRGYSQHATLRVGDPPTNRVVSARGFADANRWISMTVSPTGQVTQWYFEGTKTLTGDLVLSSRRDRWKYDTLWSDYGNTQADFYCSMVHNTGTIGPYDCDNYAEVPLGLALSYSRSFWGRALGLSIPTGFW